MSALRHELHDYIVSDPETALKYALQRIVVLGVLGEDSPGVPLVVDQQSVSALDSHAAYEPLRVGVHLRHLRRALEDLDALGGEGRVEGWGVAAVAIAE